MSLSLQSQRGIGLIETMLAMVISLMLIAGVVQIVLSSKQSYRMLEAASRLQEDGRFAMEMIGHDVRIADFWGCVSDRSRITNHTGDSAFAQGVTFDEDSGALRLANAIGEGMELSGGASGSSFAVPAGHGLRKNQPVLIADCERGDIVSVSGPDDPTHATTIEVAGTLSKNYGSDARLYPVEAIDIGLDGNTLERDGQPVLNDVDTIRFSAGVDASAPPDGSPDYYTDAADVSDWSRVTGIRIHLLLQSAEDNLTGDLQSYFFDGETVTSTDRRLRRSFTTTVAVRNRIR